MNTKNLIVICVAVYLVVMSIGLLFWPTVYRYQNMKVGGHWILGRINRVTGGLMVCHAKSGGWVPIGEVEFEKETPRRLGRGFGR